VCPLEKIVAPFGLPVPKSGAAGGMSCASASVPRPRAGGRGTAANPATHLIGQDPAGPHVRCDRGPTPLPPALIRLVCIHYRIQTAVCPYPETNLPSRITGYRHQYQIFSMFTVFSVLLTVN
jgi:hypothetical protein